MAQSMPTPRHNIPLYLIIGLVGAAGIGGWIVYQNTNSKAQSPLQNTVSLQVPDQASQIIEPNQASQASETLAKTIDITLLEQEIHKIANQKRNSSGVQPISYDARLAYIAKIHSQDMATHQYLSHNSYDGHDLNYRYAFAGYSCKAPAGSYAYSTSNENIAVVTMQGNEHDIAQHIVNVWFDSTSDRYNILDTQHQAEGIGVALTENKMAIYATEDFC